jgi:hypothetical protein
MSFLISITYQVDYFLIHKHLKNHNDEHENRDPEAGWRILDDEYKMEGFMLEDER